MVERDQGGGIELAQCGTQRVDLTPALSDHRLVRSDQDLDRLDRFGACRDRPVVVTVGVDHIGQNLGVAGIGCHPPGGVTSTSGSPRTPSSQPRPV